MSRPRARRRSSNIVRPAISISLQEGMENPAGHYVHSPSYDQNFAGVDSLTRIFGDLNIEYDGRASFVNDVPLLPVPGRPTTLSETGFNSAIVAEEPAYPITYESLQHHLPSEERASQLLEVYFRDIHPYMPVLDRLHVLRTWHSGRRATLSPYLLLSLFACAASFAHDVPYNAGHTASDVDQGERLSGLVLSYREAFRDAPRLSTLQAEIINLKRMESRPNVPGYFYKSWFQLSCVVRMGRDLNLNKSGSATTLDPATTCARRIWQTCLIMDQMMATAQGREMQLNMTEIDLTLLAENDIERHGLGVQDVRIHNDFIHLVGLIKILRRCTEVHTVSGIRFPFAAEPQYPALARILVQWFANLPKHLHFNPMTTRQLPSHFIGHLHLTYSMITCVLHRPWIVSMGDYGRTGEWRDHLRTCNEAARRAIAIYEMVLTQYRADGIRWMIRGNNFAIYGAVIATMIHTVCLTCPEEEFNRGAREFFDRGTKVLDRLSSISSTPQLLAQIADLKATFGAKASPVAMNFEGQTLSPEIASMQMQYKQMQRHKQPQKQKSVSPNITRQQKDLYDTDYFPGLVNTDAMFLANPTNDFMSLGMEAGDISSQSDSFSHTPSSMADWNPSTLMGAFNQTFPLPGSGLIDTSHLPFFANDLNRFPGSLSNSAVLDPQTIDPMLHHQQQQPQPQQRNRTSLPNHEAVYYQNQSRQPRNTFE